MVYLATHPQETTPPGTFDDNNYSYTFDGAAGNNIRTFKWTLPNINNSSYHLIRITGTSNDENIPQGQVSVNVVADSLRWTCVSESANCQYAYVGEPQAYAITPNGITTTTLQIEELSFEETYQAGILSNTTADLITAVPVSLNYQPSSPGRRDLKATVTTSNNSNLVNNELLASGTSSLNSPIFVMANSSTITGPSNLSHGQTGNFTLTLNGPFIGTIDLNMLLLGGNSGDTGAIISSIGGGSSCAFNLTHYNTTSNTTSCSFTFTPSPVSETTVITLLGDKQLTYNHSFLANSFPVSVYPSMRITNLTPNKGSIDGGTLIEIYGANFAPYNITPNYSVTLDTENTPTACTNLNVISETKITCVTSAHASGLVSVTLSNGYETFTLNTGQGGFLYYDISLSLSLDTIGFQALPAINGYGHTEISVQTDNPLGYDLLFQADSTELVCSGKNSSISSLEGAGVIPTNESRWGWGIGLLEDNSWLSPNIYRPILTTPTLIGSKFAPSGPLSDGGAPDKHGFFIGANATMDLPACEYTQTLKITVVAR